MLAFNGSVVRAFHRWLMCVLLLLFLIPLALYGEAQSYRIEPSPDSRLTLEVFKTGLMSGKKHQLVFERYDGTLEYDAANPEQSRVELTIDSASMVVEDDWVNEEERKKIADEALNKMLLVKKHPRMRFRSRTIRSAGEAGRFDVEGELTIRELARPVAVHVTLREDAGTLFFKGEATVAMKDYGLKPPSAALGLIGTKNEMTFRFDLRTVSAAP